jgi:hypothetical protein
MPNVTISRSVMQRWATRYLNGKKPDYPSLEDLANHILLVLAEPTVDEKEQALNNLRRTKEYVGHCEIQWREAVIEAIKLLMDKKDE